LELAVKHESIDCLTYLIKAFGRVKDINERNLLHRACIQSPSAKVVECLLALDPSLPLEKDFMGRRALHYAVESNHPTIVKYLLQHATEHQYLLPKDGFSDPNWQDREGYTPLFYGILLQTTQSVRTLIESGYIHDMDAGPDALPSSVALACKLKNLDILELMISKGASVDNEDEPLVLAIQNRFVEGVNVLIQHVDINKAEKDNGWTPLMIACIEGFKDVVEALLEAHADINAIDKHEWTAADHAVFRGYLDIGKLVSPEHPARYVGLPKPAKSKGSHRLYGHKYLTSMSTIVITLGSNDTRNCKKFIEFAQHSDVPLSLSITATHATGEFPTIDLPTDFTQPFSPDSIVIFATNPELVVIRFDLKETFGSTVLARGTSVLAGDFIFSKSKGFKGPTEKASLRGQQTVPLVQPQDLECVGMLRLEYFVVTPFEHPNMKIGDRYTYYKSVDTQVIGHRGSGMNKKGSKLQVGENTVLSFVTAASLGAEYVEFGMIQFICKSIFLSYSCK
jgi:glycerophosphodiester phosphodiesterase